MRKNNHIAYRLMFSLLLGLLFVSCGGDMEIKERDYRAELERVKKSGTDGTKKKERDLSDILKRKSNYRYSPVGKKDPFRSFFGDISALSQERKIVSELQRYDISDLQVTAIIWGITEPRATVTAPDKKSYIIKRGSFVGKNWGKVSKILPSKIEIVETYKDPLGRKILNKLYLELPVKTILNKEDVLSDEKE
ncbi:pilus assembly protein PilP [bacterium]|nr:pilus assembly protein PilP [bacterium]